jgi:regulator of protease activity HflC (stomatin/prohibitin superfamily)
LKHLVFAALVFVVGCGAASPDPGQEAVLVRKPWVFGHGGVDPTPVRTGRTLTAVSTQVWYVPTVPIQFTEHFDDLMSSDGVPLDFDASLRFQVTDSVMLVQKFGVNDVGDGSRPYPQWYAANLVQAFRNFVRQEVRKHGMNETAINTVAVEQIDRVVSEQMTKYIGDVGVPVKMVDMTVGRANPPDAIKNQRIETAAQEQRANTERQKKLAEDQRLAAEVARANADNAYRNAMSLSPEQFLKLEAIHMQDRVCAKGGCTFIAGDVSPVIGIR